MPLFACTAFYRAGDSGFSETYYNSSDTHAAANTEFEGLLALRRNMIPMTIHLVGGRVSEVGNPRDALISNLNNLRGPQAWSQTAGNTGGYNHVANALLVEFRNAQRYKNRKFLRGIPDELMINGGFDELNAQWEGAFIAWANRLKSTEFHWRLRARPAGMATNPAPMVIENVTWIRPTIRRAGRPFGLAPGRRRMSKSALIRAAQSAITSGRVTRAELGCNS